jgi:hypothetical protein
MDSQREPAGPHTRYPALVEGADAVIDWFGFGPNFHDDRIEEIRLSLDGQCLLRIAASEMLLETDADGYYKSAKHCIVSFHFHLIEELALTCDGGGVGTIIFEMEWEEGAEGSVMARWDSSIGVEGRIRAKGCHVELEPRREPKE